MFKTEQLLKLLAGILSMFDRSKRGHGLMSGTPTFRPSRPRCYTIYRPKRLRPDPHGFGLFLCPTLRRLDAPPTPYSTKQTPPPPNSKTRVWRRGRSHTYCSEKCGGPQHEPFCTVLPEQVSEAMSVARGQGSRQTRRPDLPSRTGQTQARFVRVSSQNCNQQPVAFG